MSVYPLSDELDDLVQNIDNRYVHSQGELFFNSIHSAMKGYEHGEADIEDLSSGLELRQLFDVYFDLILTFCGEVELKLPARTWVVQKEAMHFRDHNRRMSAPPQVYYHFDKKVEGASYMIKLEEMTFFCESDHLVDAIKELERYALEQLQWNNLQARISVQPLP